MITALRVCHLCQIPTVLVRAGIQHANHHHTAENCARWSEEREIQQRISVRAATMYTCVWCGATEPTPMREHAMTCVMRPQI